MNSYSDSALSGKRTVLFTAHVGDICLRLCKQISLFCTLQESITHGGKLQKPAAVFELIRSCLVLYLLSKTNTVCCI